MLNGSTQGQGTNARRRGRFTRSGKCVLPLPKMQTIIQDRMIETAGLLAESDEKQPITFQHSILCQTCLPYRDPGAMCGRGNGDRERLA